MLKPSKPSSNFPLYPHNSGKWAKKINGRVKYFGSWKNGDTSGTLALEEYRMFSESSPKPATSLIYDWDEFLKSNGLVSTSWLDLSKPLHKVELVYVLDCEGYYVKIGKTNNIAQRHGGLSCGVPFQLRLIAVHLGNKSSYYEQLHHRNLSRFRGRGEWFIAVPEVYTYVANNFSILKEPIGDDLPKDWPTMEEIQRRERKEKSRFRRKTNFSHF